VRDRVILHLDMDAFFASVEQKTFPFLRGKPIGVCGEGRTVIASASYEAKAFGVKSGMNLSEAKKCCPNLILVSLNPAKYIDTAQRVIGILLQFTDLVEVFSIDEAFLDVTNTAHLFEGAEAIAHKIKDEINKELGLTCSIGIAPNKLLAKYASDQCKPNGILRIKREDIPELLKDLPVNKLCGIGERLALRLKELGILTLGDLAKCPIEILLKNFGKNGIRLKNMGMGFDPSPVLPYWQKSAAKSIGHSCTLDSDTSDLTIIKHLLWQLSEQVARRLRQGGYQGKTVTLLLRYSDFTTLSRQKSIKEFIDDGRRIYEISFKLFKYLYQPPRKIRLLGVVVSNLIKGIQQLSLLDQGLPIETLDNLNDRYGEFTIRRSILSTNELSTESKVIAPSWRG